jgi:F-type H+-transporting ATPase subunit b
LGQGEIVPDTAVAAPSHPAVPVNSMEQIFQQLKEIIVRAIPSLIFLILIHWYLKKVLFLPLQRVLDERFKRTQGSVEQSEATLAKVNEKLAQYQKALSDARAMVFAEQESRRRDLTSQQAQLLIEARQRSDARVNAAKASLQNELDAAKKGLGGESDRLAEQIAGSLLAGRAA